jgi:hypothetical protein
MKKFNSRFLITVLMLAVTSVLVLGQKKVLFIGRSQYIEVADYQSDRNLYDSLAAYGFEMTYLWNDTYKEATEYDYSGFDGVFINETVDSKAMAPFGPARDNYPLPCVTLEAWAVAPDQDRWGWIAIPNDDLIQPGGGEATEDNTIIVILDNSHYITEIFQNNEEVKWSNATGADLTNTGTIVIREVNVEYSGKLATIKANIDDTQFYNLVTIDKSDDFPNNMVLWGINAIGLDGGQNIGQEYGTQEFFEIVKRACEWAYDAMPAGTAIEDHVMIGYQLVAFPNPASVKTTIRFNVPSNGPAKVTLYDVTGQQTDVLLDKNIQVGNNFIFLDVTNYSRGVYFVKLQFEERTEFTKLVIN